MALKSETPSAGVARLPRLHALQALRFLAAFGVMVHHSLTAFGPPLTNVNVGSAGVDVFFMISGVVIGYADHDDGAIIFAAKRVIRVLPLYWIATFLYGTFRYFAWKDDPSWARILHSVFLIPDFSGPWVPIYYPAWTLCFELAFYILFGLVLTVAGRATTLTAALVAIALAALPLPVPFYPGAIFDTPPCLEFAAGLLMAEAWSRGFALRPALGVLSIILAIAGFSCRLHFDSGLRVLQWGIPSFLLVMGVMSFENSRIFRWPAIKLGGDASYALYLFHIPVMEGIVLGFAPLGIALQGRIRYVALREFLLLLSALAVGIAVHLYLERPMLKKLRVLLPRRV